MTNSNRENEKHCEILIGLTAVFTTTTVITTAIIIVLSWKLYNKQKNNGELELHSLINVYNMNFFNNPTQMLMPHQLSNIWMWTT